MSVDNDYINSGGFSEGDYVKYYKNSHHTVKESDLDLDKIYKIETINFTAYGYLVKFYGVDDTFWLGCFRKLDFKEYAICDTCLSYCSKNNICENLNMRKFITPCVPKSRKDFKSEDQWKSWAYIFDKAEERIVLKFKEDFGCRFWKWGWVTKDE